MRSVLRATGATLLVLASSHWVAPAQAQEKVSVAVLRFVSSGGLFIAVLIVIFLIGHAEEDSMARGAPPPQHG